MDGGPVAVASPPLPPPPPVPASPARPQMAGANSNNRRSKRISRSIAADVFAKNTPGAADDDATGKTAVKVAVRVRPALGPSDPGFDLIPQRFRESTCDVPTPSSLSVQSPQGKKLFVFDRVFDETTSQQGVWDYLSDSVSSFVQGYNVSILAYGQSGSGKSYTMGTSGPDEQGDQDLMGVVPRAAQALFDLLNEGSTRAMSGIQKPKRYSTQGLPTAATKPPPPDRTWTLKATYVEIYNEQLRDLLAPPTSDSDRAAVAIREDTKGRILLTGLTQVEINSVEDLLHALNFGSSIRQTDSTLINARSSRSHAVFSLNLVQRKSDGPANPTPKKDKRRSVPVEAFSTRAENVVTLDSKLHFVDLAGSERLKNTGATGDRAKEGISINAGLASLGKVISQLSSRHGAGHISYRDSRLTRLLQDSLGGNAITFMVACVTPAVFHLSETLNTVHYAQRARAIQSKPEIQQTLDEGDKQAAIERLRAEITFLRDQIRHAERNDSRVPGATDRPDRARGREAELQTQLMDMQENYNALSQRHTKLISEISRARDSGDDSSPLKGAGGDNAVERLNRSNSFAEAVEGVLLEYEKTIESLNQSLSSTRASLSTREGTLLEKDARIAYMDTIQQQLQARVQKALDREQSSESYVRDLESRVEGASNGEEQSTALVTELRKELQRIKERETSAEDYISTLEDRLAEAEQDGEIMQREVERLEHVIERQRSIGRLDNLLTELDGIRPRDQEQWPPGSVAPGETHRAEHTHDVQGGLVPPTINGHATTTDDSYDDDEYDPFRPKSTKRKTPRAPPVKEVMGVNKAVDAVAVPISASQPRSLAQDDFMADKLENLTQELFDLRGEHENNLVAYDSLHQKYETALQTLAELRYEQEAKSAEESNDRADGERGEGSGASPAPETSTTADQPSTDEKVDKTGALPVTEPTQRVSVHHVDGQREMSMSELESNYQMLADEHRASLQQVEDLKLELHRQKAFRGSSTGSMTKGVFRRRADEATSPVSDGGSDRASKSFTSLKNIAHANLDEKDDARQSFEVNLNNVMNELNGRTERVQALEAELASLKKEMENKQQLITGLTRERANMKTSMTGVDFSIVVQMREQLEESERRIRSLQEEHATRERELQSDVDGLKVRLDLHQKVNGPPLHTPENEHFATPEDGMSIDDRTQEQASADQVMHLQNELSAWETRHDEVVAGMKHSESTLLQTIAQLEEALRRANGTESRTATSSMDGSAPNIPTTAAEAENGKSGDDDVVEALRRELRENKETANNHLSELARLQEAHEKIQQQIDRDAKTRDLSDKELETHRTLVSNLESQLQVQRSAIEVHQESLKTLQASHSDELDKLRAAMGTAEKEWTDRYAELEKLHKDGSTDLEGLLKEQQEQNSALLRDAAAALGYSTSSTEISAHIRDLVDEGKELQSRHAMTTDELKAVQNELGESNERVLDLEAKMGELKMLNEETILNLQKITEKEHKASRLVEELEVQLTNQYDSHQAKSNRMSTMQTEKDKAHADIVRELEEQKKLTQLLELQVAQQNRGGSSAASDSNRGSGNYRDSLSPEAAAIALARSPSTSSNVRKSNPNVLPTPPPSIPLPPLPGTPGSPEQLVTPPGSRHISKEVAMAQLVEEQEARIRAIEKHLFAEKQLTATLEEALVDLETSANRTKTEMETWRKKCVMLEDELVGLRKEKSNSRASLQAVEEEREMRLRAEKARQALEQRMMELNAAKKKKKNALNCF